MVKNLFNNLKSKSIKKTITINIIISLISVLYLYIIISYLFPFAIQTRSSKIIIVFMLFVLIFLLFFVLYWTVYYNLELTKKQLGQYLALSIVFATVIFFITNAYTPLYPADLSISIRTEDEIGYMHINREDSNGNIISLTNVDYIGEWNYENGIRYHLGRGLGQIIYKSSDFVAEEMMFHIIFIPRDSVATIEVDINGQIQEIVIPTNEDAGGLYIQTIYAPLIPSSSTVWEIWRTVFPIMRWITLVIFFLGVMVIIFKGKHKTFDIVLYCILLFITGFLFYNAFVYQNSYLNFQNYSRILLLVSLLVIVLIPFLIFWLLEHRPQRKTLLIISIFLIAFSIRIYWLIMVPSGQYSDPGLFHNWALQLASGEPGIIITKHANFTRLLSIVYMIHPEADFFKVLNVLFSLLTMLNLWLIGKTIHNEKIGIIAAFLFAVSPSQIGMVTIVSSDIIGTSLLSLSVLFMLKFIRRLNYWHLFGSGFVFGIAVAIRAPLLIFSPFLFSASIPLFKPDKDYKRIIYPLVGLLLSGLVGGYFTIKGINSTVKVDNMLINEERNVIEPLLMGTNIDALGRHNTNDLMLLSSWKSDEIVRNGLDLAFRRISQEPLDFFLVLRHKYAHMFGNATYISDAAFLGDDMNYQTFQTRWPYDTQRIRNVVALLSQYSHVVILGLAIGVCFLKRDQLDLDIMAISLIIIGTALIAYSIFEVQPRYFRPVIPYIMLYSSLTLHLIFYELSKLIPTKIL